MTVFVSLGFSILLVATSISIMWCRKTSAKKEPYKPRVPQPLKKD
jgi:hypothetical protein